MKEFYIVNISNYVDGDKFIEGRTTVFLRKKDALRFARKNFFNTFQNFYEKNKSEYDSSIFKSFDDFLSKCKGKTFIDERSNFNGLFFKPEEWKSNSSYKFGFITDKNPATNIDPWRTFFYVEFETYPLEYISKKEIYDVHVQSYVDGNERIQGGIYTFINRKEALKFAKDRFFSTFQYFYEKNKSEYDSSIFKSFDDLLSKCKGKTFIDDRSNFNDLFFYPHKYKKNTSYAFGFFTNKNPVTHVDFRRTNFYVEIETRRI